MKKRSIVLSVLLVLTFLFCQILFVESAYASGISVLVDGRKLAMDTQPVQESGRVLVPMRDIFEAIDAKVDWNPSTQTVTGTKDNTVITLKIGSKSARVGSKTVTLDVPAKTINGRTLVPIRFVSEALGATVNWNSAAKQVIINSALSKDTVKTPLEGSLKMSGSTSVQPVAEELAQAFMKKYSKVQITVTGGGSGVGIKDAAEGKVNIGMSSRALRDTDPTNIVGTAICKDVLVVAVNPKNPVSNLTVEQVKDIYTGKITNWKDVGGNNAPILINARTAPSGTFDFFNDEFLKKEPMAATAKQHASNGLVRQAVAANENAIGYVSLGYVDNSVKALSINGIAPTMDNAKKGTYFAVRPFLMITQGTPDGLAKAFLEFVMSDEGQKIVAKEYLPVK